MEMSVEHWWNNTDGVKPKYLEKNVSHCQSLHHKFYVDWRETEPGPSRWDSGDYRPHVIADLSSILFL